MNRMEKILEAFLNEQLHVDGGTEGRSLKQQKICERGSELQDKLAKKLNTEEQEMLSELVEILFKESCSFKNASKIFPILFISFPLLKNLSKIFHYNFALRCAYMHS